MSFRLDVYTCPLNKHTQPTTTTTTTTKGGRSKLCVLDDFALAAVEKLRRERERDGATLTTLSNSVGTMLSKPFILLLRVSDEEMKNK